MNKHPAVAAVNASKKPNQILNKKPAVNAAICLGKPSPVAKANNETTATINNGCSAEIGRFEKNSIRIDSPLRY